jgi:hypothetical protein
LSIYIYIYIYIYIWPPLFANFISFSFLTHFESSRCELKFSFKNLWTLSIIKQCPKILSYNA